MFKGIKFNRVALFFVCALFAQLIYASQAKSLTHAPLQLAQQSSHQLLCNVNVNCSNQAEIVRVMRSAWSRMRSAGGMAAAYADVCFDALRTVQDFHQSIPLGAGMIQPQLNACNIGLAEIR